MCMKVQDMMYHYVTNLLKGEVYIKLHIGYRQLRLFIVKHSV